jgi:hypothetical protein
LPFRFLLSLRYLNPEGLTYFTSTDCSSKAIGAAPTHDEGWHLRRADEIDMENVEIVDLKISNENLFPGRVFEGTVESMYNEIKALDPTSVPDIDVSPNLTTLGKRSTVSFRRSESYTIANRITVRRFQLRLGQHDQQVRLRLHGRP